MRVKKMISLQDDVLEKATTQANKLFGGNFSMYLTYLINKDCEGIVEMAPKVKEEPKKEALDEESLSSLDDILGF